MPRNKRLHFKDMNALRAIAFVPIYLFSILLLINNSSPGVLGEITSKVGLIAQNSFDFFFFLSVFLLTSNGLREYKYLEHFSLKNFLVRRVLRIIVVLVFALIFAFIIHPWLTNILDLTAVAPPELSSYILLYPNYASDSGANTFTYLFMICTVYMFLQFSIVWGLVLKYLHKSIITISVIAILIGIASRIFHIVNETSFLLDTLSFGIPIGVGAITAHMIRNENTILEKIQTLSKKSNTIVYVIGVILCLIGYALSGSTYLSIIIPILTSLFFAFIVIEQTFGKNSFVQFKTKKILSYLGRISYGLIIYQSIIGITLIIAADSLALDLSSFYIISVIIVVGFVASLVTADISFKLFEKPLLRIRRAFKKV